MRNLIIRTHWAHVFSVYVIHSVDVINCCEFNPLTSATEVKILTNPMHKKNIRILYVYTEYGISVLLSLHLFSDPNPTLSISILSLYLLLFKLYHKTIFNSKRAQLQEIIFTNYCLSSSAWIKIKDCEISSKRHHHASQWSASLQYEAGRAFNKYMLLDNHFSCSFSRQPNSAVFEDF